MTSPTLPNINDLPATVQQRLNSLPSINVYRDSQAHFSALSHGPT